MPKRHPDHLALRSCAVCRQVKPKGSMTRLVRLPDGSVDLDASGKAAGRGTYVCTEAACHEPGRLTDGVRRALGAVVDPETLFGEEMHATT